jgi:hypothetical protein
MLSQQRGCLMKKIFTILIVGILLISITGCTTLKLIARGNKPIILNTPPKDYTVLNHFTKERMIAFDYTGAPDISQIIQEATGGYPNADAIINVFITVKTTPVDFLLNLFTIGLAYAYTLRVEGDIIQFKS